MRMISLKLPPALFEKLAAEAERTGKSKSAILRDALEAYLDGANGGPGPSCYDLAKDLLGSVEGPSDLSYNQKHLEGFGR
jgi:predicted DNA-binding protein